MGIGVPTVGGETRFDASENGVAAAIDGVLVLRRRCVMSRAKVVALRGLFFTNDAARAGATADLGSSGTPLSVAQTRIAGRCSC